MLLLLAVTALAGCGGDDDDNTKATDDSGPSAVPSGAPQGSSEPAGVTCDYPVDELLTPAKEVDPPPSTPAFGGEVPATLVTCLLYTSDAADE